MPRTSSPAGEMADELADVAAAPALALHSLERREQPPDRVVAAEPRRLEPGRAAEAVDLDPRVLADHPRVRVAHRAAVERLRTRVLVVVRAGLAPDSRPRRAGRSRQPGSSRARARAPCSGSASRGRPSPVPARARDVLDLGRASPRPSRALPAEGPPRAGRRRSSFRLLEPDRLHRAPERARGCRPRRRSPRPRAARRRAAARRRGVGARSGWTATRSGQSANRTSAVAISAAAQYPAPAAMPIAATIQRLAAVVSPRTETPWRRIAPAPRKPTPVTICAAIRVGS